MVFLNRSQRGIPPRHLDLVGRLQHPPEPLVREPVAGEPDGSRC